MKRQQSVLRRCQGQAAAAGVTDKNDRYNLYPSSFQNRLSFPASLKKQRPHLILNNLLNRIFLSFYLLQLLLMTTRSNRSESHLSEQVILFLFPVLILLLYLNYGQEERFGRIDQVIPRQSLSRCLMLADRKSTRLNSSHVSISYAV